MFFLLRSACCIAVVVAALPESGGHDPVGSARELAASGAGQLCRATPSRCRDLLVTGMMAGIGGSDAAGVTRAAGRPSRDTLSVADRHPAWVGPRVRLAAD